MIKFPVFVVSKAGKLPPPKKKRLFLHKDRSLCCDVLQSPMNSGSETDQRRTWKALIRHLTSQSHDLSNSFLPPDNNSSPDLDCQNLTCYFEETHAGKTDAGFSIACSSKKCNSLSQMDPDNDSVVRLSSLDCNQHITFCVRDAPAETKHGCKTFEENE